MPLLNPTETKRIDSKFYVEGYATTFNDPYVLFEIEGNEYSEMVESNAFQGADMSDVIMQFNHEGRVLARISNKTLGVEVDEHGLFTFADLSKSNVARDMYSDISEGLVNQMSWGFTIAEDEYDNTTRTRIIKKVKKVYDVSAVSIPANPGTDISARSYFDGVIEVERQELARKQKELELRKAKYFYMGV